MAHRYHINMVTCFTAATSLELGLAWTCEFIVLYNCTSSIQFCDTSNVSHLILQCASLHGDFQARQFISGKRIHEHDIEVPADRKHGHHARLGLSIDKKPLRHFFLRHSGFFHGAGRIMLSCGHLVKGAVIKYWGDRGRG